MEEKIRKLIIEYKDKLKKLQLDYTRSIDAKEIENLVGKHQGIKMVISDLEKVLN